MHGKPLISVIKRRFKGNCSEKKVVVCKKNEKGIFVECLERRHFFSMVLVSRIKDTPYIRAAHQRDGCGENQVRG